MIRDLDALVFALHNAPGVYAMLLGSGVSRGAEIPTGWEIIQDLIRKVAYQRGDEVEGEPAEWYREQIGEQPNYSKLLEQLASSRAERQALLKGYFEPNEDERERGVKMPTEAHGSVARLVTRGVVRVIVTTNFDRLLEMALEEEGVTPTVVSTPSAIKGAPPLAHTSCTVLKLHGDYLDTRIRNTEEELSKYPQVQQRLLRQVFDEFGLVVCGWSGEWDQALYDALLKCKNQRYTTYWAAYQGQLTQEAQRLIQLRQARVVSIESAESFLSEVAERLAALEEFDRAHPLSKEIALAQLKRYLSEERYRIRLHDLLLEETERTYRRLSLTDYPVIREVPFNAESLGQRLQEYEATIDTLESLIATGAFWDSDQDCQRWWKILERIGNPEEVDRGLVAWIQLQWYPAARLFYAGGLGALAAENYGLLWKLLSSPIIRRRHEEPIPLCSKAHPGCIHGATFAAFFNQSVYDPRSEYFLETLRAALEHLVPAEREYEVLFDRFELLVAVGVASLGCKPYVGRFSYNTDLLREVDAEFKLQGDSWQPLSLGFCDGSAERFKVAWAAVNTELSRMFPLR